MARTAPQVRLRILSTTDLHGTIWPHDYEADRTTNGRGLAALAPVIRTARAEVRITLEDGNVVKARAEDEFSVLSLQG